VEDGALNLVVVKVPEVKPINVYHTAVEDGVLNLVVVNVP
jgi:hypothetical protein